MIPKVSVIIPVHNAENYLPRCLDSLLSQSLKDIEIICINDGSTDASLHILKQYSVSDSRLTILSQPNAGAGAARNRGLELASGEYLSFLDADDWFDTGMLEKAYAQASSTHSDICIFQAIQFDESSGKTRPITWGFNTKWIPGKETFSHDDVPRHFFQAFMGWAWDKVFRTEFIRSHNLQFPPLHNSEDQAFVFSALALARSITTLDQPLLTQRVGNTRSLSNSRTQHSLCFCESLQLLKQNLLDANIFLPLRQSFANWALEYTRWNLLTLAPEERKNACHFLREEGIFRLGIADMAWREAYSRRQFNQLRSLLAELPGKRIAQKIFPWTRKLSDLIKRPILSIIIPVYNVENYLRPCLDSILKQQNVQDYEIICVNDGSTDNSASILNEYQLSFPSLIVITQCNQGLSEARNTGLSVARGTYIGFVDSDDFIEQDMFSCLVDCMGSKHIDLAYCGAKLEPEAEFPKTKIQDFENYLNIAKKRTRRISRKNYNGINCVAWNKIFKKSIIDEFHIRFPKGLLYEDNVFVKKYIIHSGNYSVFPRKMYHYRLRNKSLMNTENPSFKNAEDHLLTSFIAYRDIVQSNRLLYWIDAFYRYLHLEVIHALEACPEDRKQDIFQQVRTFLITHNFSKYQDHISKKHALFFQSIMAENHPSDVKTIWADFKRKH